MYAKLRRRKLNQPNILERGGLRDEGISNK